MLFSQDASVFAILNLQPRLLGRGEKEASAVNARAGAIDDFTPQSLAPLMPFYVLFLNFHPPPAWSACIQTALFFSLPNPSDLLLPGITHATCRFTSVSELRRVITPSPIIISYITANFAPSVSHNNPLKNRLSEIYKEQSLQGGEGSEVASPTQVVGRG